MLKYLYIAIHYFSFNKHLYLQYFQEVMLLNQGDVDEKI